MRALFVVFLAVVVTACTPAITRVGYTDPGSAAVPDCEVIFKEGGSVDAAMGEVLGQIELDDTGFTIDCGEAEMLALLKNEACSIGANLVLLKEISPPDLMSSCYRVKADLIRLDDAIDPGKMSNSESLTEEAMEAREQDYMKTVLGYALGFAIGYGLSSLLF